MSKSHENQASSTGRACVRRWLDWLLLLGVSVLVCLALYPFLEMVAWQVARFSALWPWWLTVIMAFGSAMVVAVLVMNLGGLSVGHFRQLRFLRFPPTWMAGVAGSGLYAWLSSFADASEQKVRASGFDFILAILLLCVAAATVLVTRHVLARVLAEPAARSELVSPAGNSPAVDLESLAANPELVLPWVERERPIAFPSEDLFEHVHIARRVAQILRSAPLQTVGIVGPFGCGKTSMLNLTSYYLKHTEELDGDDGGPHSADARSEGKRDEVVTCALAGWGLQEGAVAERLLATAIGAMQPLVDCIPLTMLPSQYKTALSRAGNRWSAAVSELLSVGDKPERILGKLDAVLEAVGARLVVFLEDLDRNTDGFPSTDLFALLDRLHNLQRVSFVLVLSPKGGPFPLFRMCEHVELIPGAPLQQVAALLRGFRRICLSRHAYIDPLGSRRDKMLGPTEPAVRGLGDLIGYRPLSMETAALLRTPRTLKAALRRTLLAWGSLHGEIDFDDLLLATVLRTSAPEAYDFVFRHLGELRRLELTQGEERQALEQTLASDWDRDTATADWDKKAARELVGYLFPVWVKSHRGEPGRLQGVATFEPTDYWARLNTESISATELRDQLVLAGIQGWKQDHGVLVSEDKTLAPQVLSGRHWPEKVQQFGRYLDGNEVRKLASQLFELALSEGGSRTQCESVPGFISLWQISSATATPPEHDDWLLSEIEKALPVSLRFANDLFHIWGTTDRVQKDRRDYPPALRKRFVDSAREAYENAADLLVRALDPGDPYSIRQFVVLFDGTSFDPASWSWFATPLVAAGRSAPQIVVPQLACLLTDGENLVRGGYRHTFRLDRAEAMFGPDMRGLMEVLSAPIDARTFGDTERGALQEAQAKAQEWLSSHATQTGH